MSCKFKKFNKIKDSYSFEIANPTTSTIKNNQISFKYLRNLIVDGIGLGKIVTLDEKTLLNENGTIMQMLILHQSMLVYLIFSLNLFRNFSCSAITDSNNQNTMST